MKVAYDVLGDRTKQVFDQNERLQKQLNISEAYLPRNTKATREKDSWYLSVVLRIKRQIAPTVSNGFKVIIATEDLRFLSTKKTGGEAHRSNADCWSGESFSMTISRVAISFLLASLHPLVS